MRAHILKYLKNTGTLRFRSKELARLSGSPRSVDQSIAFDLSLSQPGRGVAKLQWTCVIQSELKPENCDWWDWKSVSILYVLHFNWNVSIADSWPYYIGMLLIWGKVNFVDNLPNNFGLFSSWFCHAGLNTHTQRDSKVLWIKFSMRGRERLV